MPPYGPCKTTLWVTLQRFLVGKQPHTFVRLSLPWLTELCLGWRRVMELLRFTWLLANIQRPIPGLTGNLLTHYMISQDPLLIR